MRGHLKKRSKDSWSIVIDMGRDSSGKRIQKWSTVKGTKKDAEKRLTEILNEIDTGTYIDSRKLTVKEYLNHWLENHAVHHVALNTFNRYSEICIKHLSVAFQGILLQKLHPLQITDYYTKALESGRLDGRGGLSAQTVKHHHRVFSEALKQAVKWQLLLRNPCDAVTPPKPIKKEMRALDKSEINQLIKASSTTRINIPLELTLSTGLRRGELLALKWSDLSWANGDIKVNRSLEYTKITGFNFKTPKTNKSRRTIPLPRFALDGLKRHQVKQKEQRLKLGPIYQNNDLIFSSEDGQPWKPDSFTASFRHVVEKSGIGHVRFHDLRHTHATQLFKAKINPKIVSERLGHSSIAITLDTYSHVLPGIQDAAVKALDKLFESA